MNKRLAASVSIVEQFGTPEQMAALASAGIPLSPTAMAKAQAFTASAKGAERRATSIKAAWDRQTDKINARTARFWS